MVAHPEPEVQGPTRARLLEVGMDLFAARGFRTTTVGEIEAAAGLQPRRGALYKHFPSKQALLEAAVQHHLDAVDQASRRVDEIPLTDVRAEALLLGQWLLHELESERQLVRVLEQDGDRLTDLRDRVRHGVSDAAYRSVGALVARWTDRDEVSAPAVDVEALATLLLGSLVNIRRSTWTFAAPPLGLDDGRVVTAWADLCVRLVGSITDEST